MTKLAGVAGLGLGIAALCGGCTRTMIAQPLAIDNMQSDPQQDLEFWHSLPGRSAVSNNEGLHGLILLADGTDPHLNYEARLAYCKEKGWVGQGFNEPADMAMQRGTLAKAITVQEDIKGGVMMWVTNKAPRYATRELVDMRIMGEGTDQQVLSGLDYVGVISKSQDYVMARDAAAAQKGANQPMPPAEPAPAAAEPTPGGAPAAPAGDGAAPAPAAPAAEQPAAEPAPKPAE